MTKVFDMTNRYDDVHSYLMELEGGEEIVVRECLDCGVLAINEGKHDSWHDDHVVVVRGEVTR